MKKVIFLIIGVGLLGLAACSKKSGCPATESLKPPTNKSGQFVSKGGHKSELFPKNIRKKMH